MGVYSRQHQSFDEREEAASACTLNLNITIPVIVAEIDNILQRTYQSSHDRLYIGDSESKISYRGGAGPHFLDVEEWDTAIQAYLSKEVVASR